MRNRPSVGRGRPRGSLHPRPDIRVLEYIDKLSLRFETDRTDLFHAIVHAWEHKKAKCLGLNIEFRAENKGQAIFLITKGQRVIAQFPIQQYMLKETNPFGNLESESYIDTR